MRAVIQRVSEATVTINKNSGEKHNIKQGIVVFLGIEAADDQSDIQWLAGKISRLRIFSDEQGQMNLSLPEIQGDVLLISQFTLHAYTKKGNRPSFIKAAKPEIALPLYQSFQRELEHLISKPIQTGVFGAYMEVQLINDGPVTILIDTKNKE
jgi:D-aminoacyl-tRNA deacylase